jgi:Domain of unknown function (DUF6285)
MNDLPTALELLAAARYFLEKDLIPTLSDARLKFQTLITANVLAIVERELQTEQAHLQAEYTELSGQLGGMESAPTSLPAMRQAIYDANRHLCKQIRRGDHDDPLAFCALLNLLRASVERKLQVANPRYLASSSSIS